MQRGVSGGGRIGAKGGLMRHGLAMLAVFSILLLGCTLLPPPKAKLQQNGGPLANVSVEELAAREQNLAAFREASQRKFNLSYKAIYLVSDGNSTVEQSWYFKPPKQKVDVGVSKANRTIVVDNGNLSYRCDSDQSGEACYLVPEGYIGIFRPEALRQELAASRLPEGMVALRTGSAPSSVGALASSCFSLISAGLQMVACYTAEGIPSYVKLEVAGKTSEVALQEASTTLDSDYALPAHMASAGDSLPK